MTTERILARSENQYEVSLDEGNDTLVVEAFRTQSRIVINLVAGTVIIESPGDISFHAGGKLTLKGDDGVDIISGSEARLVGAEETIIRGKMVRIN